MKASREAIPLFYSISVYKEPDWYLCLFLSDIFLLCPGQVLQILNTYKNPKLYFNSCS